MMTIAARLKIPQQIWRSFVASYSRNSEVGSITNIVALAAHVIADSCNPEFMEKFSNHLRTLDGCSVAS